MALTTLTWHYDTSDTHGTHDTHIPGGGRTASPVPAHVRLGCSTLPLLSPPPALLLLLWLAPDPVVVVVAVAVDVAVAAARRNTPFENVNASQGCLVDGLLLEEA